MKMKNITTEAYKQFSSPFREYRKALWSCTAESLDFCLSLFVAKVTEITFIMWPLITRHHFLRAIIETFPTYIEDKVSFQLQSAIQEAI